MNNKWIKGLSVTLCAALAVGAAGVGIHAANSVGNTPAEKSSDSYPAESVAVVRVPDEFVSSIADDNSESVYVLLDADGTAQRVITSGEDGELNYDGSTSALPVSMRVSYTLDGTQVAPADLAGKSGHVVIRFDYENHQRTADGTLVPFAVMTGVLMDSDVFSNVTVTNGRLMSDGSRVTAVGAAFPGLQESLGLDVDTFELPSYVEIAADTTSFKLESTYTLVTNAVFSDVDIENMDSLDDLEDASDKLTDAMGDLEDGSDAIYDGLVALSDGVVEYTDGTAALSDGLDTISGNSAALNDGARQVFDALLSTANEQIAASGLELPALTRDNYDEVLSNVLRTLSADGVEATARAKVETAVRAQSDLIRGKVTEAVQAEVGSKVKEAVQAEVSAKVTAAVKAEVAPKVEQAVKDAVTQQVLAAANMTPSSYQAALAANKIPAETKAQLEGAIAQQMESDEVKAAIEAKIAEQMNSQQIKALTEQKINEQMNSQQVKALIDEKIKEQMASDEVAAVIEEKTEEQIGILVDQNMASEEVQAQIKTGLEQAGEGAQKLAALKGQLDSYNTFYTGLLRYTGGVDQAAAGARELRANSSKLIEGAAALRDGAKELADGLRTFDREGIEKVADALDGDVAGMLTSVKDVCAASREYTSFTGTSGVDSVRFIYRTEAIGVD